jgi:hypothetical protein
MCEPACYKCGAKCGPNPGEEGDIDLYECYECGLKRVLWGEEGGDGDGVIISYALPLLSEAEWRELRLSQETHTPLPKPPERDTYRSEGDDERLPF